MISVANLKKSYGDHTVLDGVSIEIQRGEVVAMIGPSGAGKSTLLRCLNLLERPDSGRITIGDTVIDLPAKIPVRTLETLRKTAGMVFQSFNLFPHLSVLRNVSLAQEYVLGRDTKAARRRSMELLERVGLADKAGSYPARLSGGQQQRIAIARALAMEPEVMLFDEPTSALDPELGLDVLAVMRELAASGMTMVVVTHEIHFAQDVSDRVVMMADGGIIEQGDPAQVLSSPANPRTQRFLKAVIDR
ncbi:amino acid ABC transporter ATP-binding protein [Microtetraspora sp. AC03309]|uniref:amino acid ABC transporter ATP-binding protein n=1 Tax=Microtetraspora sp. AC03309 TaxID=2779376 RepID=UPI001E4E3A3A|nr:amino acid ABC transporter ATP-binding protein [Microtetraspora sp. AC03309]MCC5581229.1 amino acid ABC transporter ATP-binding protein [Microtetraspora sp. AC03309]